MNKKQEQELKRYEKLLQDWKPGGDRREPQAEREREAGAHRESIYIERGDTPQQPARTPAQRFQPGAILVLNGQDLVVYQRPVPSKEYDLVLALQRDGRTRSEGVALDGHQIEEIGRVVQPWFEYLQSRAQWDRDLIVFHLSDFSHVGKVPHPDRRSAQGPATENGGGRLRRGERLKINFGNNTWEAIYWGRDSQGDVVAHSTHGNWALMHLDLKRFSNGLTTEGPVDSGLIDQIEAGLSHG